MEIPDSALRCGSCGANNDEESKFCASCGHGLYESCPDCGKKVALTQSFCSHCGCNLLEKLEAKQQHYRSLVAEAISHAKNDQFESALSMLQIVSEVNDYRFKDVTGTAHEAIDSVRALTEEREKLAEKANQQALSFIDSQDHERLVSSLEQAPMALLDEEVKAAYEASLQYLEKRGDRHELFKESLARRDWVSSGELLNYLILELPGDETLLKLSEKIGDKLFRSAKSFLAKRQFPSVQECLDALPSVYLEGHSERQSLVFELRQRVEDILWLESQQSSAYFDTPTLGKLSQLLQKLEPKVTAHNAFLSDLTANLKRGERIGASHWPVNKKCSQNIGSVDLLHRLDSVVYGDFESVTSRGGLMTAAFGLALNGLGLGQVSNVFGMQKGKLAKLFGVKKSDTAWGIDVGSASVKGVKLERRTNEIVVVDAFFKELENPTCRFAEHNKDAGFDLLEAAIEGRDMKTVPAICSLPSDSIINRFSVLPPVNDSAARALAEREISEKFPVNRDQFSFVTQIADLKTDASYGRPCSISAANRQQVAQYLSRYTDLGVRTIGLQPDSLAVANLLSFECRELLAIAEDEEAKPETTRPAIAALHMGAAATSLVYVSDSLYWVWSVQFGGEDLTSALAKKLKITRLEAEKLKRDPVKLGAGISEFRVVQDRLEAWVASRLISLTEQAHADCDGLEVRKSYATGGGSETLGFIHCALAKIK